ncbi:MAG: sulfite exporter TauE/SafE family protein [Flavobacteriales bacterium]
MPVNEAIILLAVGVVAGFLSGLVGIGGGIIIVPVLVYLGLGQKMAQGTVLFMFLLPIGILGVWNYYKAEAIDYKMALIIATTFVAGSYFGSKLAVSMDQDILKKVFGVFIILVGVKLIFWK